MADKNKSYLGDGLYYEFDGYQIRLFTPSGKEVFLESSVLEAFIQAVSRSHDVLITVEKKRKGE